MKGEEEDSRMGDKGRIQERFLDMETGWEMCRISQVCDQGSRILGLGLHLIHINF